MVVRNLIRPLRWSLLLALLLGFGASTVVAETPGAAGHASTEDHSGHGHAPGEGHGVATRAEDAPSAKGAKHAAYPIFGNHQGTWFNGIARAVFGQPQPVQKSKPGANPHFSNVNRDFVILTAFVFTLIGVGMTRAAKKTRVRPEGKATAGSNIVEAAVDTFRDYLIGVMGEPLARKYTPLICSFFFTILACNWVGLVPGMIAPTSIPAIPISFALVAFVLVHVIAIRETSFKSWFMHFVGQPLWLAPLLFPLHIVGELIKPLSLSLRLLCNVFGEEQMVAQLTVIAMGAMAVLFLPIPFQLPILMLGTFFGFLQALVFSTLLSIYISILATHHDDHDAHNDHGHVEHDVVKGRHVIVGHPSQTSVA